MIEKILSKKVYKRVVKRMMKETGMSEELVKEELAKVKVKDLVKGMGRIGVGNFLSNKKEEMDDKKNDKRKAYRNGNNGSLEG